jgi:hypothetical protein
MRQVKTTRPSFPAAPADVLLEWTQGERWQVLCGDEGHWRLGAFAPPEVARGEIAELEQHDCPELFVLVSGRLTLVIARDGEVVEVPLEAGRPILVASPHAGYCPDGPHTGVALVIERDAFDTEYRAVTDW